MVPSYRSCYRQHCSTVCLVLSGIHYLEHLNEQQIIYLEASTSYGERKQLLLPDGTQLTLNSCSHVRYPNNFTGEERKIVLEGEGYFQVHRNEEQPFIVSTRRFDVRVLGTCFDIKSYSSDEIVSVEVESGKVQVDLPEAMMRLKGKEQVLINTISGEYSKRREERPVAIWKKAVCVSTVLRYVTWQKNWNECTIAILHLPTVNSTI